MIAPIRSDSKRYSIHNTPLQAQQGGVNVSMNSVNRSLESPRTSKQLRHSWRSSSTERAAMRLSNLSDSNDPSHFLLIQKIADLEDSVLCAESESQNLKDALSLAESQAQTAKREALSLKHKILQTSQKSNDQLEIELVDALAQKDGANKCIQELTSEIVRLAKELRRKDKNSAAFPNPSTWHTFVAWRKRIRPQEIKMTRSIAVQGSRPASPNTDEPPASTRRFRETFFAWMNAVSARKRYRIVELIIHTRKRFQTIKAWFNRWHHNDSAVYTRTLAIMQRILQKTAGRVHFRQWLNFIRRKRQRVLLGSRFACAVELRRIRSIWRYLKGCTRATHLVLRTVSSVSRQQMYSAKETAFVMFALNAKVFTAKSALTPIFAKQNFYCGRLEKSIVRCQQHRVALRRIKCWHRHTQKSILHRRLISQLKFRKAHKVQRKIFCQMYVFANDFSGMRQADQSRSSFEYLNDRQDNFINAQQKRKNRDYGHQAFYHWSSTTNFRRRQRSISVRFPEHSKRFLRKWTFHCWRVKTAVAASRKGLAVHLIVKGLRSLLKLTMHAFLHRVKQKRNKTKAEHSLSRRLWRLKRCFLSGWCVFISTRREELQNTKPKSSAMDQIHSKHQESLLSTLSGDNMKLLERIKILESQLTQVSDNAYLKSHILERERSQTFLEEQNSFYLGHTKLLNSFEVDEEMMLHHNTFLSEVSVADALEKAVHAQAVDIEHLKLAVEQSAQQARARHVVADQLRNALFECQEWRSEAQLRAREVMSASQRSFIKQRAVSDLLHQIQQAVESTVECSHLPSGRTSILLDV